MGAKSIQDLGYRCGYAFIGIAGRRECTEKRAIELEEKVSITKVFTLKT